MGICEVLKVTENGVASGGLGSNATAQMGAFALFSKANWSVSCLPFLR
jgi:hypothetical protein